MQTTLLTAALSLLFVVVAAAALVVRAFLRATEGTSGLGARIERLFHLPERTRRLATNHYYCHYWRTR